VEDSPPEPRWEVKPDPVAVDRVPLNLTGSIPLVLMGLVVYSTAAESPFVAVTPPGTKDRNQLQVYDMRRMKPVGAVIRGKFDGVNQKFALSPDGTYFAAVLPDTSHSTVEVWSVADGRSLHRIEVDPDPKMKVGLLDFVVQDRILTMKHEGYSPLPEMHSVYQVWDVRTGKQLVEFSYDLVFLWRWGTLSPGRKYLVMEHTDNREGYHIVAWDLTTGKPAGRFSFQGKKDPWGQARGLAFSPDGQKLAMLWRLARTPGCWGRLLCWDVKTHRKIADHPIGYEFPSLDTVSVWGGTVTIQWLPDGSGWLLFHHLLVDYRSGAVTGKLYPEPNGGGNVVEKERRFLDQNHITAIEGGTFDKKLMVQDLTRVRSSRPLVRNPDQGLKDPGEVFWDVKPDSVSRERVPLNLGGSVPLEGGAPLVYPTSAESPFVAITPRGSEDQLRVYDLRRMTPIGSVIRGKFNNFGQVLTLSPDGAYLATNVPNARLSTVEVWSVATGRRLRQIEVEPDPDKKLILLDFAGKDRLLTENHRDQRSTYRVWDLTTGEEVSEFSCKLEFDWKRGGFSPGLKYLVLEHTDIDEGYRFLCWDLTTGRLAGRFPFQDRKDPGGQAAGIAFSPDGQKMAMLWRLGQRPDCWGRLLCWDVRTRQKLADHKIGYDLKSIDALWARGGTSTIQWLPDGSGWLLFNHLLIDHRSGAVTGTIPPEPDWDGAIVERRFLDSNHLSSAEGAFDKKLAIIPLPHGTPK
jgi:WD40 repeat protein